MQKKVCGEEFRKISQQFYRGKKSLLKKGSNLNNLKKWKQKITFKNPNTDVLNQRMGGPCGVFAVIQAFIILLRQDEEKIEYSQLEILHEALLSIMENIADEYAFCTEIDSSKGEATFVLLSNRGEALRWLSESCFVFDDRAILLFSFTLTYLVRNKPWFSMIPEPFVYSDSNTSMMFVWMMLTGRATEEPVSSYEHQQYIGLSVVGNDERVNGVHLNPGAFIYVVHRINHFYCVVVQGEKEIVFDPLK